MILDNQLLLSDAQAVTADAASTNYYDLGAASRALGVGEPMAIVVTVDVAADATTGDETYAFQVQTDDNTSFSSATTLQTRTVAAASLTAGAEVVIPLGHTNERYVRLYYDVGGTTPTITVTAFIQPMNMIDAYTAYPDASTIS